MLKSTLVGSFLAFAAPARARPPVTVVVLLDPDGHSVDARELEVAMPAVPIPPPAGTRPRAPSSVHLAVTPMLLKDDSANVGKLASVSLGYRFSDAMRVVATAGFGSFTDGERGMTVIPLRLGVERLNSIVGVELGGIAIPYMSACDGQPTPELATGVYGVLRFYFGIGDRARLVVEGGGYYLGDRSYMMCHGPLEYQSYAGWAGLGLEWSL
jgi:hypothetical protein